MYFFFDLELISSFDRKRGFVFIFFSVIFLLLGYIIGASLIQFIQHGYTAKEYIYSVVYGALFYTALVTMVSMKIF
jgi:hypothetical protein